MAARRRKLPAEDQAPPEDDATYIEEEEELAEGEEEELLTIDRDRGALAREVELSPVSLVGSYFHRLENGAVDWQGIVIAEVQPGVYLCEILGSLEGARVARPQVMIEAESMAYSDEGYEWRFYNTEEDMAAAFAEHELTGGNEE